MLPLILGTLWIIAASFTALLPMRAQLLPGLTLLIAAPLLLLWIGLTHGFLPVTLGLFAFISMFRRPLSYFARKALRLPLPDLPPEFRRPTPASPTPTREPTARDNLEHQSPTAQTAAR